MVLSNLSMGIEGTNDLIERIPNNNTPFVVLERIFRREVFFPPDVFCVG